MTKYTRVYKRSRWVGQSGAILQAVEASARALREWSGGDDPCITIDVQVGKEAVNLEDVEQLSAILTERPEPLKKLDVKVVGAVGEVQISQSPNQALFVEVSGADSDAVHVLWALLGDIYGEGQHAPQWYDRELLVVPVMLFLGFGLTFLGDSLSLYKDTLGIPIAASVAVTEVGLLALLVASLTPNLELLRPGGQSRARRFRMALAVSIVLFALAVAALLVIDGVSGR